LLHAKIIGTGSCLPDKVITNHDLEKMVDTNDEWITERTGIKERRVVASDEAASDIAYKAARRALKAADMKASDLDLILVGTVTPDTPFPSAGCVLQSKLGAKNAVGFDVSAACSGFLYALQVADSYIKSKHYERVLVVGVDVLSKITDWEDRCTCVLFGDGAGAVVLVPTSKKEGIIDVQIGSNGKLGDILYIPGGGSKIPASHESVDAREHFIKMNGNDVFKVAVKTMQRISNEILERNNMDPSEVDIMIPHQANIRIIQAVAKRLKMPMEKVFVNLDRYGNTSAATIPIALDEAVRGGRVSDGDTILMAAFGGGLTWASALLKW